MRLRLLRMIVHHGDGFSLRDKRRPRCTYSGASNPQSLQRSEASRGAPQRESTRASLFSSNRMPRTMSVVTRISSIIGFLDVAKFVMRFSQANQ